MGLMKLALLHANQRLLFAFKIQRYWARFVANIHSTSALSHLIVLVNVGATECGKYFGNEVKKLHNRIGEIPFLKERTKQRSLKVPKCTLKYIMS